MNNVPPMPPNLPPPDPNSPWLRMCFSGHILCTAIQPCPGCVRVINERILPAVLQRMGATRPQAQAFFQAWGESWRSFHQALLSDPNVAGQLRMLDVRPLIVPFMPPPAPAAARPPAPPWEPQPAPAGGPPHGGFGPSAPYAPTPVQYPNPRQPQQQYMPPAPAPYYPPPPPPPPVIDVELTPIEPQQPPPSPSSPGMGEAVRTEIDVRRKEALDSRVRASSVSIEDLEAAAEPASTSVLGNVMGPGFVPAAQRGRHQNGAASGEEPDADE